ncbi:MAG TPA: hypothetical protein PLF13_09140 [candidate division Zixibacteria bacterium]|nr:hypothetical protein [candidate division Zixibacteria bacterium]
MRIDPLNTNGSPMRENSRVHKDGQYIPVQAYGQRGATLIEVVLVIIIMGILAATMLQSSGSIVETARYEETKQELDQIAVAIIGNPSLRNAGVRTDFGYVGDVGALPPNLAALKTNPGSYTTWNGPYLDDDFAQASGEYAQDAWGTGYTYTGGVEIRSTGSGSDIVKRLANTTTELLNNAVYGNVYDADGTIPGSTYADSITILLSYPDGAGGTAAVSTNPDNGGYYEFSGIPIGLHPLEIVLETEHDTLRRFVEVTPGSSAYLAQRLTDDIWYSSSEIPGLIGHYPLDDDTGQTAIDLSSAGYDAYLQNDAAGAGWTSAGKISGAFDFDGVNDYFQTTVNNTDLQIASDYSASVWIYAEASQVTWAAIFCKCTPTGNDNHWTLQWNDASGTSKKLTVYHPSGGNWSSTWQLSDAADAWHHVVITYDGSAGEAILYIDGALYDQTSSLSQGPGNGDGKFRIGCDRTNYTWNGKIDDLRIYDRVLSADDVVSLYNMGVL